MLRGSWLNVLAGEGRKAQGKRVLRSVRISNLTVFREARFALSGSLNIIVGENGTGKSHVLKLIYSVLSACQEERKRTISANLTKTGLQSKLADKLVGVFKAETLGRLARRQQGRARCDLAFTFSTRQNNLSFGFATNSKTEVAVSKMPESALEQQAVFIPTRELLSIFPGFVSVYDGHYLEFEETWRDTCLLLGAPLQRGPREARIAELLAPLEEAMGGAIVLDRSGRFYLLTASGRMEIQLVAEGLRKLGMVARLVATGALLDGGYLLWDEPESNLNPRLIRGIANTIVSLSRFGVQVFIATHSLFLLREIEIVLAHCEGVDPRFFGLHRGADGVVVVESGASIDDIGQIAALDEELYQSDRFLEV